MSFLDTTRRLFGFINVEVITRPRSYTLVKISGIRGDLLTKDLQYYYNTSRVANYVFDKITGNAVVFPAFFALEVLEIMHRIIDAPRANYTSRRTASFIKDALLEKTWLERLDQEEVPYRLDLTKLNRFKLQPLPYQKVWLGRFEEVCYRFALNGAILDATPGSGKTMMSLYVSECSDCDVTVVVTPKNAIDRVWHETLKYKLTYEPTVWRTDSSLNPYNGERYMLVHYESIGAVLKVVDRLATRGKKICVIVDESHNFNEPKSARTQNLIELCRSSKSTHVILQSGTPFKAIGAEIVPALYCIDPTFDEGLAERFKKLYAASATEALTLLQRRLGFITHKVHQHELKLAPPIIENVKIKTPNGGDFTLEKVAAEMMQFVKERAAYYQTRKAADDQLFLDILSGFEKNNVTPGDIEHKKYITDLKIVKRGDLFNCRDEIVRTNAYERSVILPTLSKEDATAFKEVKTIYKYVTLKIQGEALGRILGRRRMACSVEIAKGLNYDTYIESTTKKTLFFTVYVQALEQAVRTLKEKGYTPAAVYGETNSNLAAIIQDFEKNEQTNPLVASYHSLSTAVPLTVADRLVCLDLPFRSYVLEQSIARINRLGADTQTYVFIVELDTDGAPNLSTRTIDILKWSQSQIERITGTASPFEITDTKISLEAFALAKENLKDAHFAELGLEEAYMANLE